MNLADHQQAADATSMDGLVLTVPLAAAQPNGTYLAGILEFGGVECMIERHVGDQLYLEFDPADLSDTITTNNAGGQSTEVLIAPGCNLTSENCSAFNNIENFGGFAQMLQSPFDGRSIA